MTDSLVKLATSLIGSLGLAGVALLTATLLVSRSGARSAGSGAEGTEHGESEQMAVDVVGQ
ncbi:MAG TPA: hypothetical protein VIX82_14140 [Solirubrobacteraceae bacterium]